LSEDQDELFDTTEDLEIIIKDQSDYISQLNVELGQSITKVEDDIQTIKSSKYGKKIWIVKKKSKKSKIIKSNLETNDLYPPQDTPQQDTFNDQRWWEKTYLNDHKKTPLNLMGFSRYSVT